MSGTRSLRREEGRECSFSHPSYLAEVAIVGDEDDGARIVAQGTGKSLDRREIKVRSYLVEEPFF